jgi:hypothetical protein
MRQLGAVSISRASPKLTHGAELPTNRLGATEPPTALGYIARRIQLFQVFWPQNLGISLIACLVNVRKY